MQCHTVGFVPRSSMRDFGKVAAGPLSASGVIWAWSTMRLFAWRKIKRSAASAVAWSSVVKDHASRCITAADISFPSARPSASSCARFMTLPMSALPVAPVSATACSTMAVSASVPRAAGR